MEENTRKDFFEKFIMMLANQKILVIEETPTCILGQLTWPDEPDKSEEIRQDCKEKNTPSSLCFQILSFITSQRLLDIDKIPLPRRELYNLFCKHNSSSISFEDFESTLEELLEIEFIRIKNGKEFDSFYVHE